jgi:hypothetical protein
VVLQQGVIYGRVAADVGVLEAVAGEPAGEQARNGALYAVVLVPVDLMILYVHTTCGVPLRRRSGRGAGGRGGACLRQKQGSDYYLFQSTGSFVFIEK